MCLATAFNIFFSDLVVARQKLLSLFTFSFFRDHAAALLSVTGQSFARELMSAGLIVVGQTYYTNLGPQVATTILAAIATALGVLPFLFYLYGPKIRDRSKYSQEIKQAAREDEARAMLEDTSQTPQNA